MYVIVENKHDGQVFNEKLIYDLHANLYQQLIYSSLQ